MGYEISSGHLKMLKCISGKYYLLSAISIHRVILMQSVQFNGRFATSKYDAAKEFYPKQ
jgi:hypothetical protein